MSEYGAAPSIDQAEITVFGPGYGEAIAIHLGDGRWILVDSCIRPDKKQPASLYYLQQIGVPFENVKIIVASHWHDDHARGIATVSKACPDAFFFMSGVFNDEEATSFLYAYGSDVATGQSRGTRELFEIASTRTKIKFAYMNVILLEENICDRVMRVLAFSPTTNAQNQTLRRMASYLPKPGADSSPITHAPELRPNVEAVVLHVDFGDDSVLLGSDMENGDNIGWSEILQDEVCLNQRKAASYKVAHHGSKTGHADGIWSELLAHRPIAYMTPFIRGSQPLPTEEDRKRIKKSAEAAYITSAASRRPTIPHNQLKRMQEIGSSFSKVNPGFGAVRLRKTLGTSGWIVETFGDAHSI